MKSVFISKDELEANETVQKCKADFPHLTEGQFYILRNEITAFDRNNNEGKISFDGYSGTLVYFEGFSAQGNAHFNEPVLSLQENGTLKNIDGVCELSFYIPVSDLNAADFEPFNFEESEFMEPDDILIHAYTHIEKKKTAISVAAFLLLLTGIGGGIGSILFLRPIIAVVSICVFLIALILFWLFDNLKKREVLRKRTAPFRYKRLSSLRKYTESLGIDPYVSTFKGHMGVRLSKISENNV